MITAMAQNTNRKICHEMQKKVIADRQTDNKQAGLSGYLFHITVVGRFLQSALDVFLAPSTKYTLCSHEMKFNDKQIEREITQKSLQNTIFYLVKAFPALLTSSKIYLKENCS